MPIKYDQKTQEKARYYYLNGSTYTFIKRSLDEEYGINIAKSTLSNWKKKNGWDRSKEKIREEVVNGTERKATDSIGRRLKVLENLELQFIKKLNMFKGNKVLDIKPDEYIRILRESERLQEEIEGKDMIIRMVSEKLPFVMKQAGLKQKQINAIIRTWIEETREI